MVCFTRKESVFQISVARLSFAGHDSEFSRARSIFQAMARFCLIWFSLVWFCGHGDVFSMARLDIATNDMQVLSSLMEVVRYVSGILVCNWLSPRDKVPLAMTIQ